MTRRASLALAMALAASACGGRAEPPRAQPARQVAWPAMSDDEKLEYMTKVVMPEMKSLFVTFDARRFPKMTCATCHGKDGPARGWKMPNPDLLLEIEAVTPTASQAQHHGSPAMDDFMRGKVAPRMAALLGRSPSDPAKPGAECWVCHTLDR